MAKQKPESTEATPRKRTPTEYLLESRKDDGTPWLFASRHDSVENAEAAADMCDAEASYRIINIRRAFKVSKRETMVKEAL